jgi:hypothetical protein
VLICPLLKVVLLTDVMCPLHDSGNVSIVDSGIVSIVDNCNMSIVDSCNESIVYG